MATDAEWGSLPFDEAIQFFRQKLSVPTAHWDELWGAANDRAFTVAGATAEALRADLLAAVDSAVAKGTTLEQFRKDFRDLVQRHGWTGWTGEGDAAGVAWRTEVIYGTNCATAYAAGRYTQLTHPDVTQRTPYWLYRHSDSVAHPRPLHVSWDGLVLRHDDPWWTTHYPPNGWGCKCTVFAVGERDLKQLGKKGPDVAPNDGTYEWVNKRTGEVHQVPEGIDPGWDYAPGASGPFGPGPSKPGPAPTPAPAPVAPSPPAWEWISTADHARLKQLGAERWAELVEGWALPTGQPLGKQLPRADVDATDLFGAMPALREHLMQALAERRELGARVETHNKVGKAVEVIRRAAARYPADWVRVANTWPLRVVISDDRGFYDRERWDSRLRSRVCHIQTSDSSTAEHEYGHHLQYSVPHLDEIFQAEHRARTAGDDPEVLYAWTPDEYGRPDGYIERYQGREYAPRAGLGPAREVLTMALQPLLGRDARADRWLATMLLRDRAMVELALGVLFHFRP